MINLTLYFIFVISLYFAKTKMKFIIPFFLFILYSGISLGQNNIQYPPLIGKASYYADKFHNRKSASGRIFRQEEFVCAHRSLPFGTDLLVVNPQNNKSVVVKVIDRGPFIKGRIIDLSYAAAKQLDFIRQGVIDVEIFFYNPNAVLKRNNKTQNVIIEDNNLDPSEAEIENDIRAILEQFENN